MLRPTCHDIATTAAGGACYVILLPLHVWPHTQTYAPSPPQIAELSRSPTNFRRKIFTLTSPTESTLPPLGPQSPCESLTQSPTLSPIHSPNNSPSHSPSHSPATSRKSSSEGTVNFDKLATPTVGVGHINVISSVYITWPPTGTTQGRWSHTCMCPR